MKMSCVSEKRSEETGDLEIRDHKEEVNMCLQQLLQSWLLQNRLRLKETTLEKYQSLINTHILPSLGRVPLKELHAGMINQFLVDKLENGRLDGLGGLSASYVRTMMLILNAAIKYGVTEGWCEPLRPPVCRFASKRKQIRILSVQSQKKLESYIENHFDLTGAGILLALYAGLRIGEICALSWNDIDLENRVLLVRNTVSRAARTQSESLVLTEPKTRSSIRVIPISSSLLAVLHRIPRPEVPDSVFVVTGTDQFRNPRTFEYRYHRLLQSAGIERMNFHTLRHTFATRCIHAGVDIKSLSEVLGHASTSITLNIYVHSSIEIKREQLEKLTVFMQEETEAKQ